MRGLEGVRVAAGEGGGRGWGVCSGRQGVFASFLPRSWSLPCNSCDVLKLGCIILKLCWGPCRGGRR